MMESITDSLSVKNLLLPLNPWRCTKTICNDFKISVRPANIHKNNGADRGIIMMYILVPPCNYTVTTVLHYILNPNADM